MATLVSQATTGTTYTLGSSDVIDTFFGLSNQAEALTYNGAGTLRMIDVSNGDRINLSTGSTGFTARVNGNTISMADASNGHQVELGALAAGESVTVQFSDAKSVTFSASSFGGSTVYTATSASSAVTLTGSALGLFGAAPEVGSTNKAPWTLLMNAGVSGLGGTSVGTGIYESDGSAAGTGLVAVSGLSAPATYYDSDMGVKFKVNADLTKAYFYNVTTSFYYYTQGYGINTLGISDGTAAGTSVLRAEASGGYIPGNFSVIVNDQLVLAGATTYGGNTGKVLVSDGTVAGTTLKATDFAVMSGSGLLQDPSHQTVWFSANSTPYGQELGCFNYGLGATPNAVLVKDIYPGSSNGFGYSYSALQGAVLPNGNLVFNANDGVNGNEPWVSDGTESGTIMLLDLSTASSGSSPYQYTNFGGKVVFSANFYNSVTFGSTVYGYELVFTDGTSTGTTVLDVTPGYFTSNPVILGQAGGLLYFTATTGTNSSVQGIYSTDGTNVTRLADINSGATMLAWGATKAYFKVSDAAHGDELWAADLVNSSFALVKDILPGSGAALGSTTASNTFMVGGKLAFNAYTSATQSAFFLSDGTAAGTVQIGNGQPTVTKILGDILVFSDTEGVHAVNAANATAMVINLCASTAAGILQSDADQVFYLDSSAQLFASNGVAAPVAPLASHVTQFKVVAEDALFFIQTGESGQTLWYSDGTVAGTRFIEALPTGIYDLGGAVALRTAGTAPPTDNSAPILLSARVNAANLVLSYSDSSALDGVNVPAVSAFILGGTSATVSGVAVSSSEKTVTLTLSQSVKSTDVVTVSYTDPTTGNDHAVIQDSFGNDAASLQGRYVINQTADNIAPVLSSAVVDGKTLTLVYSDTSTLDSSHLPAAGAFSLAGTVATVSDVAVDSATRTVTLTLSQAVSGLDVITLSYTDPTTGNDIAVIQDSLGNDAVSLLGQVVMNQTPVKSPWTLLMYAGTYASAGIFESDG